MRLTGKDFFGKIVWVGGTDQERCERLYEYEENGCSEKAAAICMADYAADEHPYKERGNPETYSEYNQGWNDACDYIREKLEG